VPSPNKSALSLRVAAIAFDEISIANGSAYLAGDLRARFHKLYSSSIVALISLNNAVFSDTVTCCAPG
jgi:hypothetical protein